MPQTISRTHRDEALRLLDRAGLILSVAREVSQLMRQARIPGAVIGGIAVVLHGHLRATKDIDVFLDQPLPAMADTLVAAGFHYDDMGSRDPGRARLRPSHANNRLTRRFALPESCKVIRQRRESVRGEVPVHLVTREQIARPPRQTVEIDGITTVSLADLVDMKLESGSKNILRAQDLADVIGLIRHHALTGEFARRLDKSVRQEFRKLVKAIEEEDR